MQTNCFNVPLQNLLDQSSDLIQGVSFTGQILYTNRAWQQQLGYNRAEALTLNVLDITHPSCHDLLTAILQFAQDKSSCNQSRTEGDRPSPALSHIILISKAGHPILVNGTFEYVINSSSKNLNDWGRADGSDNEAESSAPRQANMPSSDPVEILLLWQVQPQSIGAPNPNVEETSDLLLSLESKSDDQEYQGDKVVSSIFELPLVYSLPVLNPKEMQQCLVVERDAQFSAIFENASVGIVTLDTEGQILETNVAFEAMLGYSDQELFQKNLFEFVAPENAVAAWAQFQDLVQGNQKQSSMEQRLRHKQGQQFWVRLTTAHIKDSGSYPRFILGIVEEISERKQAEKALYESKAQFKNLVKNLPGMIFRLLHIADDTFSFLYVSAACQEIYNIQPDAICDDANLLFNCIAPDSKQHFWDSLHQSAKTLTPWTWEGPIVLPSGEEKWIHIDARPQKRSDDHPLWDGVVMDITTRKHTEEWLRLLESAIVNANDAIVITEAEPHDPPGPRIIYVNPAFTRSTGYELEEVLGQSPRILQGPRTDRTTLDRVHHALANWESINVELINYRKDGTEFWVDMTIVPIADGTGWYTHWMAIQRDITERKNLEEEILVSLAKERELNDLKSRFISITSHEFRTPLTSIMSSVEILDYFENTEAEKKELFEQIYSSIQHLSHLLDDVLFLGRADSNRLELNVEELDLVTFCQTMIEDAKRSFGKDHQFSFDLEGLPVRGKLDPKLLRQVFTNLLSNAVKYSDAGSLVRVGLRFEPDACVLQFSDQGIGIPLEDQSRLFDFFYRASNVNSIAGTGLGLAIVKKSVDLLGGAIAVDSEPQQGTTMTIKFPLKHQ